MNELAICKIQKYVADNFKQTNGDVFSDSFKIVSCYRWAIDEILERLMDEAMRLPYHITGREEIPCIEIIEEFANDMDQCYIDSSSPQIRFIAYHARDAADDILKLFL